MTNQKKAPGSRRRWASIGAVVGLWLAALLPLSGHAAPGEPVPAGSPLASDIRYQFAIYYLAAPAQPPMALLRQELQRLPHAPRMVAMLLPATSSPVVQADHNTTVQTSYAPPSPESLRHFGRGLSREQALALAKSQQALVMNFAHPAAQSAPAYRTSLELAERLARASGGLIWDEETREVFSPDEWHRRRLQSWDGDTPDVTKQVTIHAYRTDTLVRAITLGMVKFGLPDIVVEAFPWSSNSQVGNLMNVVAQAMLEGQVVGPKGAVDVDLRRLRHAGVRKAQLESLLPEADGQVPLVLAQGTHDEGDPENRLVEIRFDRAAGPDAHARRDALLASLYGSKDNITHVRHDDALLKASQAAQAKLPALRAAFNQGLAPGEYLLVKAPFKTPSGGNEWMWVEVMTWRGDAITGLLKNDPFEVTGLHAGQMVQVSQAELFDYIRRFSDGRQEGNETGKIIQKMKDR